MTDYADKEWLTETTTTGPAQEVFLEVALGEQKAATGWQTKHYDCVNVTSHDRLARAIDWLRQRNIYRGDENCKHKYRNSKGEMTWPLRIA